VVKKILYISSNDGREWTIFVRRYAVN